MSLRGAKRRSNLLEQEDRHGPAGLAMTAWSLLLDLGGVFHSDAALQGLGDGAATFEDRDSSFGFLALALGDLQVVFDPEMRQLQDPFGGIDGALRFGPEFVGVTGYPTRLQRAGEGAGESAGGGGDEVVEGGWKLFFRSHLVEVSDFGVDAEVDGFFKPSEIGATFWALLLDDFDLGHVDGFAHHSTSFSTGHREPRRGVAISLFTSSSRAQRSEAISSRPKGVATAFGLAMTE